MQPEHLDKAKEIRPGEELNIPALEAYLNAHLPQAEPTIAPGKLAVSQFPSGFSNLTYLLSLGNAELVLRRPPFGANVKSGHDMAREYNMLRAVRPVFGMVPKPYLYCDDASVIGAPFYVMQRVQGVILRGRPPKGLTLSATTMQNLSQALVEALAGIHAIDIRATGLDKLGKPEGYVRRQVEGWTTRYRNAQTDDVKPVEALIGWLADNIPPGDLSVEGPFGSRATLIHNDFKYDNLVLDPAALAQEQGAITAVLDWEMATIGHPYMDLGTSLAYWVEATDPEPLRIFGPTALPGNYTRAQVLQAYEAATGHAVPTPLFYYVFGLLKLCVIGQQIYYRFHKGLTQDPRFAMLNFVVQLVAQTGVTALDKNKLTWA
jgi:aminoglycoside phosphotransferase (APT) family kinase protein